MSDSGIRGRLRRRLGSAVAGVISPPLSASVVPLYISLSLFVRDSQRSLRKQQWPRRNLCCACFAMPALVDLSATPALYELTDDDDRDLHSVSSTWRTRQVQYATSCETDPLATAEIACQSISTVSCSSQTAFDAAAAAPSPSAALPDDCLQWLSGAVQVMEAEVLRLPSSHAFDGFTVSWDEDREAVTRLHTLQHAASQQQSAAAAASGSSASAPAAACTAMAWNSAGSLLCVAYGQLQHAGWCSHSGLLAVWNIHRRLLDPARADLTLELQSCVSALCFHPTTPSLLAVGLHTGQIRLFDLSNAEEPQLLCSSAISALQHCEPVTALTFIPALHPSPAPAAAASSTSAPLPPLPSSHLLLSASLDGKLLSWSLELRLAHPVSGAFCSPSSHYCGQGSSNAFPSLSITALSVSSDCEQYVVGTQGGGVLRGVHRQHAPRAGMVKRGEVRWTKAALLLFELAPAERQFEGKKAVELHAANVAATVVDAAVVFSSPLPPSSLYPSLAVAALRCHHAAVTALAFSPFHPSLVLSLSADRSLRLYCLGREQEVWSAVLSSAAAGLDCCWSVSRPLVFAVADSEGGVEVWDLSADAMRAALVLRVDDTPAGNAGRAVSVLKLRWNPTDGSVLSAVDGRGRCHVWLLSGKLSSPQPGEQRSLEAIADSQR